MRAYVVTKEVFDPSPRGGRFLNVAVILAKSEPAEIENTSTQRVLHYYHRVPISKSRSKSHRGEDFQILTRCDELVTAYNFVLCAQEELAERD